MKCAPFCSLISYLYPARNRELLEALQQKRMTAIGMDMIPRTISRAQSFDTLSSQANIAGYRAVIEAGPCRSPHVAVHNLGITHRALCRPVVAAAVVLELNPQQ